MKNRFLKWIALTVFAAISLTSCGGDEDETILQQPVEETAPQDNTDNDDKSDEDSTDSGEEETEEPTSSVTDESFFMNEEYVRSALDGLYKDAAIFVTYQRTLEAVRMKTINGSDFGISLSNPNDRTINQTWAFAYSAINKASLIIQGLNGSETSFDASAYITEATALRAFIYYQLSVLWGDVPLVTETEDFPATYSQQTEATILDFAYKELSAVNTTEDTHYSNEEKILHINDTGIKLLMAEILLSQGKQEKAISLLQNIGNIGNPQWAFSVTEIQTPTAYIQTLNTNTLEVIYDSDFYHLLLKEAQKDTNIEESWMNQPQRYGKWAALKRLGVAKSSASCEEYELKLPIPAQEIQTNPSIKQNPGY